VVTKDGQTFEAKTVVANDTFGYVYFPKDFGITADPGMYQWKCFVNNREVAGGKFNLDNRDFLP